MHAGTNNYSIACLWEPCLQEQRNFKILWDSEAVWRVLHAIKSCLCAQSGRMAGYLAIHGRNVTILLLLSSALAVGYAVVHSMTIKHSSAAATTFAGEAKLVVLLLLSYFILGACGALLHAYSPLCRPHGHVAVRHCPFSHGGSLATGPLRSSHSTCVGPFAKLSETMSMR